MEVSVYQLFGVLLSFVTFSFLVFKEKMQSKMGSNKNDNSPDCNFTNVFNPHKVIPDLYLNV